MKQYGMRITNTSCIVASACLLYLSLLLPAYFFWGAFACLVVLAYGIQHHIIPFSFYNGFLWGVCFYLLHWAELWYICYARTAHWIGMLLPFFLITYFAAISGIWFWLFAPIKKIFIFPCIAWALITTSYILTIQKLSLWPISGMVAGYPFSFPLLSCAAYPFILCPLSIMPTWMYLACWVLSAWCVAYAIIRYEKEIILFSVAMIIAIILIIPQNKHTPITGEVGHIPIHAMSKDLLERAYQISQACNKIIDAHGDINIICLPEATFPVSLEHHPEIVHVFEQNIDREDICIVIGTYHKDKEGMYNSCHLLQNCLITERYDKLLLTPFVEFSPNTIWGIIFLDRIFNEIKHIRNLKPKICKSRSFPYQVLICSDFFLDWYDQPQKNANPLLLLVNETWFSSPLKNCMNLCVRYGAIARQQDIFYLGHECGKMYTKEGMEYNIPHD